MRVCVCVRVCVCMGMNDVCAYVRVCAWEEEGETARLRAMVCEYVRARARVCICLGRWPDGHALRPVRARVCALHRHALFAQPMSQIKTRRKQRVYNSSLLSALGWK